MKQLIVPTKIWMDTWQGLKKRGGGKREAACIWGGKRTNSEDIVEEVYFFDDVGDVLSARQYHVTPRTTTSAMFDLLRQNGHNIIADVHSHPSEWVGLSFTDMAHPIEYRVGLIAIVIPSFATGIASINVIGVHEYQGDGEWRTFTAEETKDRIKLI